MNSYNLPLLLGAPGAGDRCRREHGRQAVEDVVAVCLHLERRRGQHRVQVNRFNGMDGRGHVDCGSLYKYVGKRQAQPKTFAAGE